MKNINFLKNNLIAHRGLCSKLSIENTLSTFIKCIDKNYIIELDVHILKCGTIVVYHDYNLLRLCNENKIIETLNYEQLSKIKIKGKYKIPTLEEVINIIDGKVPILIEIKDLNNNDYFEKELIKILSNYKGEFAIQSLNPYVIDWFYKNKKDYVIGLIILNNLNYKIIKKYIKKVDFLSINKNLLPVNYKNKLIIGWTIKSNDEYEKYIKICDNLICEKIL